MYILPFVGAVAKLARVVISNDDGWAEMNIRQLYYALNDAGFSSIISAPADNRSGTGSLDAPPADLGTDGCEYGSCPAYSPATGYNASMPQFMYVHSYPVTSVKYGIDFVRGADDQPPDLVVSGVNVGYNLGVAVYGSGTVGAAVEAVKQNIPAIAFSGGTGSQIGWDEIVPDYAKLYAALATIITRELVRGDRILPPDVWLNVNFPKIKEHECSSANQFKFVLSRILPAVPFVTPDDLVICGNSGRLPTESKVVHTSGCYASISVGTIQKSTAGISEQKFVYERLMHVLSCLPSAVSISNTRDAFTNDL